MLLIFPWLERPSLVSCSKNISLYFSLGISYCIHYFLNALLFLIEFLDFVMFSISVFSFYHWSGIYIKPLVQLSFYYHSFWDLSYCFLNDFNVINFKEITLKKNMGTLVGDLFYLLRKDLVSSKSQCSKRKEKYYKTCCGYQNVSQRVRSSLFRTTAS